MIVLSFSLAVDFHVINCQIFLKKKNLKEPKQWVAMLIPLGFVVYWKKDDPCQIFGISVNWQFKLVWLCIQSVVTCGTTPEHQSSDNWTSPNVR